MTSSGPPISVRMAGAVADLAAPQWDALAGGDDPFLSHAFLSLLETSGSVGPGTGWQPAPLVAQDAGGALIGAIPAYLKSHSQGEYVFDHGWAQALENAGGDYYPKLQIAVPFTPVPGRRVLGQDPAVNAALLAAAQQLVDQNGLSSAHATFIAPEQLPLFRAAGWLIREGVQFHFANPGYADFDAFLETLSSRKRRAIRKERARANAAVEVELLSGADIRPKHWDAMWAFYQDTGARKWGHPYLTRAAFAALGERMADRILLVMARRDGAYVAGALNVIGRDALFGRYWGATEAIDCLHFELCYYRAIDWAIAHRLGRAEAGAQGEHKVARGYGPVQTWSAHYIALPALRDAVADFLCRESAAMAVERAWLADALPFRRSSGEGEG